MLTPGGGLFGDVSFLAIQDFPDTLPAVVENAFASAIDTIARDLGVSANDLRNDPDLSRLCPDGASLTTFDGVVGWALCLQQDGPIWAMVRRVWCNPCCEHLCAGKNLRFAGPVVARRSRCYCW